MSVREKFQCTAFERECLVKVRQGSELRETTIKVKANIAQ